MKHAYKLILLAVLTFSAFSVSSADSSSIVVIDVDYVIRNSNQYNSLKQKLDQKYSDYQKEIAKYESEIISLDKRITAEKSTLSSNELSILKNDLSKREIKIQRLIQQKRIAIDESHSKELEKIKVSLYDIIKSETNKNKYKVVLSKASIVYNIDSIDISDRILAIFNKN